MAERVYVGLSGGVDSAVSAALLKERGYDVVGAFIKIWRPEFTECTWREDRLDAMRVCAALRIPYREVDLSEEYRHWVVDSMLADYQHGITPNPDILCNRAIKFGSFARWAREQGAARIATGHYARIGELKGSSTLLRAQDRSKDQTYFLHRLTESDLRHTIFPIGELEKSSVRQLALQHDLPVARKPDSQGLCFIGAVTMREFLARFISIKSGEVHDELGATIGEHEGAALYTIGQRHGFSTYTPGVYYVIAIDTPSNTITVSQDRTRAARKHVRLINPHWIGFPPRLPLNVLAQARYREEPVALTIDLKSSATFGAPHLAAPGQSLVFYDGERCLGGAVIGA